MAWQGAKAFLKRAVVRSKGSASEPNHSSVNLANLPEEIILCIGNELRCDPGATLVDFKSLRLVCRSFDRLFAPIVLSSIHVFYASPFGKIIARSHQLHALTMGYGPLSHIQKLTLHSWDWILQSRSRFAPPVPEKPRLKDAVKSALWKYVLIPTGYTLWTLYIDPTSMGRRVRKLMARARARKYVKETELISFQLPNVQRVSWWLYSQHHNETLRSVLLNLKILETLPSLTELELGLTSSYDELEQITASMARLHNLRKIRIFLSSTGKRGLCLKWLKQAIAHNPRLTHLEVYPDGDPHNEQRVTLSDLFEDVTSGTPLKLQHLRISPHLYQITPEISPYIRSLTSLDICFPVCHDPHPMDTIWQVLHQTGIYVNEIQTNRITEYMLHYLRLLENLTSITVYDTPMEQERNREPSKSLFMSLVRHSHSLRSLKLEPYNWGYWFKDSDVQASLLRLTKLEEVVLHGSEVFWRGSTGDLVNIARIISQIDSPLAFIIEGELMLYSRLVEYCREDHCPSLRSLSSRIAYQPSKW